MNRIIEVATGEIGSIEEDGNKTKYGEWFKLDGLPWCGMFVSWVYNMAGAALDNIGFEKGFAGCQTAVKYFKDKGKITSSPEPGDIVFFDWNADGRHDHCGIFVRDIDGKYFESIEGNTSFGRQSNGGQVMVRRRLYSYSIFVNVNNKIT